MKLDELAKSPAVQLKLEARPVGPPRRWRLVADMGRQLQGEIARAEKELASLR